WMALLKQIPRSSHL
ncbi:aminotransferase class-V family protein, partial [Vibrio parahaemolyticus V-223/04]